MACSKRNAALPVNAVLKYVVLARLNHYNISGRFEEYEKSRQLRATEIRKVRIYIATCSSRTYSVSY